MAPFFRKIRCKRAKYASTQTLGELTRDASSQRAKKRESGIAYAFGRIRPFPPRHFAYKLLVRTEPSQPRFT
jgi:hypothetical protein